ncbi:glycerate kinase [Actinopolymorpha pittospori]|uniref:Glycerate kinase n=1 Tax=Actinopolymorpha pittospori TaxID=648752 RepID=A0A927RPL5_9ACTN|nr:glycerate kinase [Actinopolymorpha pittospori]MBE1612256.1 glycerate kinase [Actinopolymorpha pittospori]
MAVGSGHPADALSSRTVVIAPDKFKHSLTALEVSRALARGIHDVRPDAPIDVAPIADGGDGTVDAAIAAGFEPLPVTVVNAIGTPVDSVVARRGRQAVVELANTCGMSTLPGAALHPMTAHTVGVGQAIAAALDHGCDDIVLGLGGSASTDAGTGLLVGLGARLLDRDGLPVEPGAAGLGRIVAVDLDGLHPGLRDARIRIAADVTCPLLGPEGSVAVFGPQKGLTGEAADQVEREIDEFAALVQELSGRDIRTLRGGGAAGGVAATAYGLLDAEIIEGAAFVLDILGFERHLGGARVVVTGEGRCDDQTLHGKAPAAIAHLARRSGVPVFLVAGEIAMSEEGREKLGVQRTWSLMEAAGGDRAVALAEAERLLAEVGRQIGATL